MNRDVGFAIAAQRAEVKDVITLVPDGPVELAGADALVMDVDAASQVITAFKDQGVRMAIDYEHSTVFKAPKGEKSIAAGWITDMKYQDGVGLVAHVEWTDAARSHIESKEYLYFSPVYLFNKDTRRVEAISSVALTNTPRMKNLDALAASAALLTEEVMATRKAKPKAEPKPSTEELLASVKVELGKMLCQMDGGGSVMDLALALSNAGVDVPEGADDAAIISLALQFVKQSTNGGEAESEEVEGGEEMAAASSALLASIGAKTQEEAVMKVEQMKSQTSQIASMSEQIEKLQSEALASKIDAKMEELVACNKINPNDTEYFAKARKFAERDFDEFCDFMDSVNPVVASGTVVDNTSALNSPQSREKIIASSASDYEKQPDTLRSLCRKKSWVNQRLREAGFGSMLDDELKKYGVEAN
jgi:phage I-like protein